MKHDFREVDAYQEDLRATASLALPWAQLKNRRVLISGASGLIGCFLVDVLMHRNQVYGDHIQILAAGRNIEMARQRFDYCWNHEAFEFVCHDINQPLPDIGAVDYIIHAASNTHPIAYATDPVGTVITNVVGTNNLLSYAVAHGARRVAFLSTVEVYGENRGDVDKFDEDYCGYINCNTVRAGYPESKRAGESLCQAYAKQYGLDVVIARLCRVYGPTMLDSDSKALAQFIRNAVRGEDIVLKSEGKQFFSYQHVSDAVSAILHILLCGEAQAAYNVADERSDITLRELAGLLAERAGTNVVFQLPEGTEKAGYSRAMHAILNPEKLKGLGWAPRYDIREGLGGAVGICKAVQAQKNI